MKLSKSNLDIFEKEGVLLLNFILSTIEVEKLREHGYIVNRVITLVDREEHDRSIWKKNDLKLDSCFTITEIAGHV